MQRSLVGSVMCIRASHATPPSHLSPIYGLVEFAAPLPTRSVTVSESVIACTMRASCRVLHQSVKTLDNRHTYALLIWRKSYEQQEQIKTSDIGDFWTFAEGMKMIICSPLMPLGLRES
jgi:hypothetical protein